MPLPKTHTVKLADGTIQRGFWLYVWEATTRMARCCT